MLSVSGAPFLVTTSSPASVGLLPRAPASSVRLLAREEWEEREPPGRPVSSKPVSQKEVTASKAEGRPCKGREEGGGEERGERREGEKNEGRGDLLNTWCIT